MTREFPDKAATDTLGDSTTDGPLTLRVHPDDHPFDPEARRVIRSTDAWAMPWYGITGPEGAVLEDYRSDQVATWPLTNFIVAGAALAVRDPHRRFVIDDGAVTCACGVSFAPVVNRTEAGAWWVRHRRATAAASATASLDGRGDMDVDAFKGGCHWCTTARAEGQTGPCEQCGAVLEGAR